MRTRDLNEAIDAVTRVYCPHTVEITGPARRHGAGSHAARLAALVARPETAALKALLQREYKGFELPASLK